MMTDPLDIYQMRVEAARINGEMSDYVRDVSALVTAVRFAHQRIASYEGSVAAARAELALMRQQAKLKDTIDTKASDYQLMIAGAERIAHAFDGED